jgi:hypothetical protein
LHKQRIYQSNPLPAILGASLGLRDVMSYFLGHKISLDAFLDAVVKRTGRVLLVRAAEQLHEYAKTMWESLPEATSAQKFYSLHSLSLASAHAAETAYQKLMTITPAGDERSQAEYRVNEMDESVARSSAALLFNFQNSCQQCLKQKPLAKLLRKLGPNLVDWIASDGIDTYRDRYRATAQISETAAELELAKWLCNAATFPPFWENYVRGTTAFLPLKK